NLLKSFSDTVVRTDPVLQLTQAYLDIKLARYDAAKEMLALTETLIQSASPRVRRDFSIVSALHRGYVDDLGEPECVSLIDSQVESLDASDHLGRGTLLAVGALAALAVGEVKSTERTSRQAIQAMRASGSVLGTNYCFLHLAE